MSFSQSLALIQSLTNSYKPDIERRLKRKFEKFEVLEFTVLENKDWYYTITIQTGDNEKVTIQMIEYGETKFFKLRDNIVTSPIA